MRECCLQWAFAFAPVARAGFFTYCLYTHIFHILKPFETRTRARVFALGFMLLLLGVDVCEYVECYTDMYVDRYIHFRNYCRASINVAGDARVADGNCAQRVVHITAVRHSNIDTFVRASSYCVNCA